MLMMIRTLIVWNSSNQCMFSSNSRGSIRKIKSYLIPVLVFETYQLLFNVIVFQVYYHLGAFDDSLAYALGAGDLFDVNGHSEYVETIIGIVNDF